MPEPTETAPPTNPETSLPSGPSQARSIAARILGAKGGKVRSPAKTRAVRANGKLGGRPARKKSPEKITP